ncbi:hypothetical protein DPM19_30645 [Actinomadura craniellae]|uniref:PBP domain-containing protein n=1 Tax=Actinomadura craniellae TaxID=2231787 RepID=A0A365GX25_9ACTN|nr:hypothetical protein DPM19_30645 [Actinomadura craniellae]
MAAAPVVVAAPAAQAVGEPVVEVWTAAADGTRIDGKNTARVTPGQTVNVRWSGFRPNSTVVISQCLAPIAAKNNYGAVSWVYDRYCAHQTRFRANTGPDGTGTASYPVKVGKYAPVVITDTGNSEVQNESFKCNGQADGPVTNDCVVVVSECEWSQPLELFQVTGQPVTLRPRAPRPGVTDPSVAAASSWIKFGGNPDGTPATTLFPAPEWPRLPDPPQPPELPPLGGDPVGAPIQGAGSVNTGTLLDAWLAGVRRLAQPADVDFIRGTSFFGAEQLRAGFQSGFTAGADYAVTGVPFTAEEAGGAVVYAPISLTALAVAYAAEYGGTGLNDIRLAPDALAMMLGDGDGVASGNWSDGPTIPGPTGADNGGCDLPVLTTQPIYRSGKSAQNQVLSSWLSATLPAERFRTFFVSEPGSAELSPTRAAASRSSENGSQGAYNIATRFGKAVAADPNNPGDVARARTERLRVGPVGYTDVTEVGIIREKGLPLPVAPLKNAAGKYAAPTKESILDAYAVMRRAADGTLAPTFDHPDRPGMYPLPMAHYLAVPRTDAQGANPMPIAKRKTLAAFIQYAVGDDAQRRVEELGGVPLPEELRKQARDVAAMLLRPDPPKKGGNGGGGGTGGGGTGGGGGLGGGSTTPTGGLGGPAPQPSATPAPSSPAPSAPAVLPVSNPGTVRGGKIPAATGVVPIAIIVIIGAAAAGLGGGWRGYLIWRGRQAGRS